MKFNEALTKEYSDPLYWKSHRLTVDAYCAQHASGTDRRQLQSVAIHLIALYLNIGKLYSDKQIGGAMDKLIKQRKGKSPFLTKPTFNNAMNINHLLAASSSEEHHAIALQWAKSVWNAWQHEHAAIAELANNSGNRFSDLGSHGIDGC